MPFAINEFKSPFKKGGFAFRRYPEIPPGPPFIKGGTPHFGMGRFFDLAFSLGYIGNAIIDLIYLNLARGRRFTMTESQKKQLEQTLWNVANQLRGKMHADEFRDYCLGFIFFKYLSELMHRHANGILREDGLDFLQIDEASAEGQEMLAAIREDSVAQLGYFLKPSQLFGSLAKRGENPDQFILDDLTSVLRSIERSTMGTESEDDFEGGSKPFPRRGAKTDPAIELEAAFA